MPRAASHNPPRGHENGSAWRTRIHVIGAHSPNVSQPFRGHESKASTHRIMSFEGPSFDITSALGIVDRKAATGEASSAVRERVVAARRRQSERYGSTAITNASASSYDFMLHVELGGPAAALLEEARCKYGLSAMVIERSLRVGRTISDLSGCVEVTRLNVAEALSYVAADPYLRRCALEKAS